jgi:hypothetical protein
MQGATAGTAASHHGDAGRAATDAKSARRAAVVIHPGKHDDIDGFRATVNNAMAGRGWAQPLWLETRPDDTGERLAREAVRSGVDLVLASGGDGTITACVGGIAGSGSRLAYYRAAPGTCSRVTSACRCHWMRHWPWR